MSLQRQIKYCQKDHEMHSSWNVCPTCLKPIVGWLLGTKGQYLGVDFQVREGKTTVGRLRNNDITLRHPSISPEHCFIRQGEGDVFTIADLSSTKGTFVNDEQIRDDDLIDNTVVKIGELEFIFKCIPGYMIKR